MRSENVAPLFFSYSNWFLIDCSVWHNEKYLTIGAKLLMGTTLVDSCSKWDTSKAEWEFKRGCARFISTTSSRKTWSRTIQFKRPGTIRNQQMERTVSTWKFRFEILVYLSKKSLFFREYFPSGRQDLSLRLKFPDFWVKRWTTVKILIIAVQPIVAEIFIARVCFSYVSQIHRTRNIVCSASFCFARCKLCKWCRLWHSSHIITRIRARKQLHKIFKNGLASTRL